MSGRSLTAVRPYDKDWESVYKKDLGTLIEWAKESGAHPVVYMPHTNYQGLPDRQDLGHERIGEAAREFGAGYIPAGLAWAKVAEDMPRTNKERRGPDPEEDYGWLYTDGIHQSKTGQALTALVLWHYLTGQGPLEMNWPEDSEYIRRTIDAERVPYIREKAAEVSKPAEATAE